MFRNLAWEENIIVTCSVEIDVISGYSIFNVQETFTLNRIKSFANGSFLPSEAIHFGLKILKGR